MIDLENQYPNIYQIPHHGQKILFQGFLFLHFRPHLQYEAKVSREQYHDIQLHKKKPDQILMSEK